MNITERVKDALAEHKTNNPDLAELLRLQEFLALMLAAGVAKTKEYDLPQPDTLGRSFAEKPSQKA